MSIESFLAQYFVDPICAQAANAPYNAYNTAAYAIIALAFAFLIYKAVKREKIKVNEAFFYSALPFVVFGAVFRVLEDAGALPRCVEFLGYSNVPMPFTSPGIYLFVALVLGACFLLAQFLLKTRKVPRSKTMQTAGWLLSLAAFAALCLKVNFAFNLLFAIAILALAFAAFGIFTFAISALKQKQADVFEKAAFFSQSFDGAATFVGTTFAGYGEQHVVGNAVIGAFGGSWAFFALKILFAFAVVMVARREFGARDSDEQQRNFVLLLIMIMGLAPGLRDLLRIAAGV